jgi:nitroimidazol reductase NimA-like FMN-containing flavoprotein (pyridoxamine 5'-phosphate oxidase superfamily)
MDDARLEDLVCDLLKDQNLAVLSTDLKGRPYASLVGFLAGEGLKHLFFVTTRATRKYDALTSNPRVAMLIDNRSNSFQDFREAMAVTAVGKAREIAKDENRGVVEAYVEKHPHLADFISSPTSALISVEVNTYLVVTRFQQVMELHLR